MILDYLRPIESVCVCEFVSSEEQESGVIGVSNQIRSIVHRDCRQSDYK